MKSLGLRARWGIFTVFCGFSLLLGGCGGSSGSSTEGNSATIFSAAGRTGQSGNLGSGAAGAGNGSGGGPQLPVAPGNGNPFPFAGGGAPTPPPAPGVSPQFVLYATETPPFPPNANPANWLGVAKFLFAQSGGATVPEVAIDRAQLDDPAGLAFRQSSSEVFVGNRHGNSSVGAPGSVDRFNFDAASGALTANGRTFQTNGPAHQLNFSPSGELFVATIGPPDFPAFPGGVERYTFDTSGNPIQGSTIGLGLSTRGVIVSPNATRLYVTTATSDILQFSLPNGAPLGTVNVPGPDRDFHYMEIRNGELYVAAITGNAIFRFAIQTANDDAINPTPIEQITPAAGVSAVAFSPDGLEMYGAGLTNSDQLLRFSFDAQTNRWTATTSIATASLVGLLVRPLTPAP